MLSVRQLTLFTYRHRGVLYENALRVKVRFDSVTSEVDEDGDDFILVKATCIGDTIPRNVELHFYGRGGDAKAWVSCDCEYFLYHCEVATERKGSTDILYSNGQRPRITNPQMIPHICKHVIACVSHGAARLTPRRGSRRTRRR